MRQAWLILFVNELLLPFYNTNDVKIVNHSLNFFIAIGNVFAREMNTTFTLTLFNLSMTFLCGSSSTDSIAELNR